MKNILKRRRSKTKLIIDEVPLNKNEYLDFGYKKLAAIKRKRAEYKERISWLIWEQKLKYVGHPYKKATVTFDIYFKYNRRRDKANYLGGGLISWLDAMVDLKIIADDNSDCIGQPVVNFHIDKANPRTEITIEGR